ncbi:MAG: GTP 3',8-cyclase MoaA [Cellulomonas sp.]
MNVALAPPTRRATDPRGRDAGDPDPVRAPRPDVPGLVDRYGRVATDLRVSLTDRCNLRCTYCMPAEGQRWLAPRQLLTDDEVIRLITIAVRDLGIREVRFTGGEPLLRRGLERIVAATAGLRLADGGRPETSLTTNGLGLHRRATALAAAGLTRVNVSLDTLDRARYATLTRRDRLDTVLAGLAAADEAGLRPVKINTVLMRGVNDHEAVALLTWALERGYELRFIEQMPLGPVDAWHLADMVTADEILASLRTAFALTEPVPTSRGAAPAQTWLVAGGGSAGGGSAGAASLRGTVGIVASVTRPFCGDCDRVRLTADGRLRDCLFARGETDLIGRLRSGAPDGELADTWRRAMWDKPPRHRIALPGFVQPDRPMSAIGG